MTIFGGFIMSAEKRVAEGPDTGMSARERRRAPRVLVNIDVDYGDEDNFLFASIRDISATGIFVRTYAPEAQGTRLNLRFTPTNSDRILDVEGVVIWVNPYRPSDRNNINPGMGIRFVNVNDDQRARLTDFIRTFAYLDDASP